MQNPLSELIEQLSIMPGIGPKSAQRLAFFFLSLPNDRVHTFASTLVDTRDRIRYCERCYNVGFDSRCHICLDTDRDGSSVCVVAEPKDILAVERTREFRGVYHVLGGLISPLDGYHPEALRLNELCQRIESESIREVTLAINPTIEGDATMLYVTKMLQRYSVTIYRLAYGLPMGSDIEYADDVTLQRAFQEKSPVGESE